MEVGADTGATPLQRLHLVQRRAAQAAKEEAAIQIGGARRRPGVVGAGVEDRRRHPRPPLIALDHRPTVVIPRFDQVELVITAAHPRTPVLGAPEPASVVPGEPLRVAVAEGVDRGVKRVASGHGSIVTKS